MEEVTLQCLSEGIEVKPHLFRVIRKFEKSGFHRNVNMQRPTDILPYIAGYISWTDGV